MNIACHAAIESREPVAVFSIEMSSVQLALRMICGYGRVNAHKLRTGHLDDDDWLRLSYGLNILSDAPIYFDDSADISVYQIRGKCRRLAKQRGLGMVVIDYLQLIRHPGKSDNRVQQISEIVAGVKSMARELNVPVIALSQLSREVEKREDKRPTLSDLRESGSIEAEADLVLLLYRPWSYGFQTCKRADGKYIPAIENGVEHIEVIVAKHRNGPTGSVYLKFEPEFTMFRSVDTFHLVEPE
jgi:replicative DNA helicase